MTAQAGAAMVHPTAEVEEGVTIGQGTRIWARSHLRRGASVGEDCNLGEGVFVDLDVQIGDRCKLQNNALVYRGAVVSDEVFIGPAACLTNDLHPRAATPDGRLKADADWTVSGVRLERGASVGAHATVIGGVTVGAFALVGAGAIVTRNVPPQAIVAGNPARIIGWACLCGHPLGGSDTCIRCARQFVRPTQAHPR